MDFSKSEFLIETNVPQDELIISRTDLDGIITHANEIFCLISGYKQEELIGKSHNLVRHPDMPRSVFTDMWKTIKKSGKWDGVIKNICKNGEFYWVKATISTLKKNGEIIGYKSQREPINYEDKLFYQIQYDKIRKENGEKVRQITYK